MQQHNSKQTLTAKQQAALNALLSGSSISAAAEAAGVHRSTLHEWLRKHHLFRAALAEARHANADQVVDAFQNLTAAAISTLTEALTSPDTPISVRLRAALAVLKVNTDADPARAPEQRRDFDDLVEAACHYGTMRATAAAATTTTTETEVEAEQETRHETTDPDTFAAEAQHQHHPQGEIPRSAPCPCGSGRKYKRCCGHNAPPVLKTHLAAAA
jgi:uncharacterized protein YchJ